MSPGLPLPPEVTIRVAGLAKRYVLGSRRFTHDTLRDRLAAAVGAIFRPQDRPALRTHWALRSVSFDVARGEVVGVIGSNGAGKSTLLKILARVTTPTSGLAQVRGRLGSLLEVGTGFHPELTGRENVFLNGAMLGMRRGEVARKFDEIVAFAEVDKFIDTPVKRYSSGMYVRLAFAVAAHFEPDILLVDEALAVGDFAFQRKCLGRMQDQAVSGRTVLFVSHNLGAIRRLCTRCVLLEDGRLALDGPADTVVDAFMDRHRPGAGDALTGSVPDDRGSGFTLHRGEAASAVVLCGHPIRVAFDVEAPASLTERQTGIGLSVHKPSGEPIVSMSTNVQHVRRAAATSRSWRVACDLGRLPLNAGTYHVTVFVGDPLRTAATFTRALQITVLEHDVFGWGHSLPPARYWGPMYWAPSWRIDPLVSPEAAGAALDGKEAQTCRDYSAS